MRCILQVLYVGAEGSGAKASHMDGERRPGGRLALLNGFTLQGSHKLTAVLLVASERRRHPLHPTPLPTPHRS